MDSAPRPPDSLKLISRIFAMLLAAGVIAYVVFLVRHSASFASGSDASGYFNSARLLSEGRFWVAPRLPPGHGHGDFGLMAFQPLGFVMHKTEPHMAPTYPTGLPLHLLVAHWIGGWNYAAIIVNVAATLAVGGVLWRLARRLELSIYWSAAGVALLWLCPLFLVSVLQPMSDVLALTWSLVTLYAALTSSEGRGRAVFAGFALSVAVLVRPTNALLVFPVALALGFDFRRYLWLALGGLPGGLFFAYYNWHVYGSVTATGYGDVGSAFSADFVAHNLKHVVHWVPLLLAFVGYAALAAPFCAQARTRAMAVLALWAAVLVGFYLFYYHTGETWWYLRFILPAFPVVILAALLALACLANRLPGHASTVLAVVVLLSASVYQYRLGQKLSATSVMPGEGYYPLAAKWARDNLPPNAAIYTLQMSGSLFFYSDFMIVRWDQIHAGRIAALFDVFAQEHRPVYAAFYDFETKDAFARLGGKWKKLDKVGETTFWELESATAAP